jgi:thiol-disulfide isomerase/thioredoxin
MKRSVSTFAAFAPSRRRVLGAGAAALLLPAARAETPAAVLDWSLLTTLDGAALRPADWTGSPAVVVFWATWCGFCRRHNARVERLHQELAGRAPQLLGVAVDGPAAKVQEHVQRHRLSFPMAMDDGRLRRALALPRVVPVTALLDAGGRVRQAIPGEMADDDVAALARMAWAPPGR